MHMDAATQALLRAKLSPARGGKRVAASCEITEVLPLTSAHMEALANPQNMGTSAPALVKIRSSHHRLAQLLADGLKQTEVSLITGFSQSRISILLADPAFQDLMSFYVQQKSSAYVDVHEKLADLGTTAMEIIRERMEEDPEKFSTRQLLDIMGQAFDRSVAPNKTSKVATSPSGPSPVAINIKFTEAKPGITIDQEVING